MGRLRAKLDQARNAVTGLETAIEHDADKLIDRVAEVDKKRATAFLQHHMALDSHLTDLTELEKDLETFGKNDRSADGSAYTGTGGANGEG